MPSVGEYGPLVAALGALIAALAAVVQSRRKPKLDDATVGQIEAKVRTDNAQYNLARDWHIVRLEKWAFEDVRPWGRQVVVQYDRQQDLLRELAELLGKTVPDSHLPPFPEMPEPLPLPK